MNIPKGYAFAAASASFKKPGKLDLGAIVSATPAVAAGVFTTNKFQAAPILQCKEMLADGRKMSGFLANSGQANACTGDAGRANCRETLNLAAKVLGVPADELLPASTGVIGAQFDMTKWAAVMPALGESLGKATPEDTSRAIMTTDSVNKMAEASFELKGGEIRLLGMCKGAGMISPKMATMLSFIVCDADISAEAWQVMLADCVNLTINRVTVDGDMSTNDCVLALANGMSGVAVESEDDYILLRKHLLVVLEELAYKIVMDAEGGTKVAFIEVSGAKTDADAEKVARAVGNSPLVKTALFGSDPNWGRIICAAGYSGADFKAEDLVLKIGGVLVFRNGTPESGNMDSLLKPIMSERDIVIHIDIGDGPGSSMLLASDLTKEYVAINADYRS
ncbi:MULTISPECIES: bifunctional glutamate N-acetyltransferase/amino-acid acetyltransferase ArgJ [unclassified Pseudodesulfovibrio]|uniref:bifunctional glutamate N-acetyltransferase/amino-acid acetyltransferase ArgJ n=1 Tax=unclassified Pseudodesulfovibrio TaxID=2661612 RepID=UPI000FEBCF17|nr:MULTISPECIES: bifunctional glutamate N-acetyltransferase/amino-acid acetyltransferase ArgJ [unclassified Pseudodesulfovibrio]MCJ2165864.1 bifunctional glutamate N-acetyltransferase/amino-acid acetyltransferase ArgJ [Pseudodesulfovibrio sp. S3-i]RWU02703.1 bifunctional glutamate N-acetyltransferase/amino-acid acetyltransferase ArgJ [Pseudodesulfovibrio sp. S3]